MMATMVTSTPSSASVQAVQPAPGPPPMLAEAPWPPPMFSDPQTDRLLHIQRTTGLDFEQALAALGREYARLPKDPCLEPQRYKAPPPQPKKKIPALSE